MGFNSVGLTRLVAVCLLPIASRSFLLNSARHWSRKVRDSSVLYLGAASGTQAEWAKNVGMVDEHNADLSELLQEIRNQPFFRLYSVDLLGTCGYMPQDIEECSTSSCEIYPVDMEDVPEAIQKKDGEEYDFEMDGWIRWDMPTEDYYDVIDNPEQYTGYDGSVVWTFIHDRICYKEKDLTEDIQSWQEDYNRAVSGLHATISAHIVDAMVEKCDEDPDTKAVDGVTKLDPMREYERRFLEPFEGGVENESKENLYFTYMLLLCAVREASQRLSKYDYGVNLLGEDGIGDLIDELLESPLVNDKDIAAMEENLRKHAIEPKTNQLWSARQRTRDLLRIMNCVQCNACRLHGKVGSLGIATAMQVLLGAEGRGGDSQRLHRVEIAGLICTLAKFSNAIAIVTEMDGRRNLNM